jgi:V/A-type H+-transporting ATPase subunit E
MDKIQQLTSKIYAEGVEKGRAEADKIIDDAKVAEKKIIDDAHKKAEHIVETATKKANELRENTKSELKMYASQALESLRTEITDMVTNQLATNNVKAATDDKAFMQKLIVDLVQNWSKNDSLTIGTANADELKSYLAANAKDLLNKGLEIKSVNGIETGFTLSPADGSYTVKFGEEEFVGYFKEFLRPQVRALLFGYY